MAEQIVVLDEQKMLDKIVDLPNQLEKAWTTLWIKDFKIPDQIDKVLVCGMGGSGISGALAQELFINDDLPIFTWADYGLPGWVNQKTLVIAISYSGDTEETADAVKKAVERQAPVLLISAGGKLKELSEIHGLPLAELPAGLPPRSALGWLYGSLLTLLAKTGKVKLKEGDLFRSIEELRSAITKKVLLPKAEELAMSLNNKLPLVAAYAPLASVARRLVTQFNENSKTTAFGATAPELCHNLVSGLDFPVPEKIAVLFLESSYGFSRNIARKKIIEKIFIEKEIAFTPLSVRAGSLLAEQLLFIHFGDLLSYYLAGVYGIDPTPMPEIDKIKEGLKKV